MANGNNLISDELTKLQINNRLLAKAVSDEKEKSKLYFNDKVRTQKQYMNLRKAHVLLSSKFQKAIKLFEDTANYISKVYEEIEKLQNIDINESSADISTLSIPRKTSITTPPIVPSCRVVAPMVSGYTIQRPFINLQRISIINRTQSKKTENEPSENDIATTINISEQKEQTIDLSNNNIQQENVEVFEPNLYLEEETAINASLEESKWNNVNSSIDLELSETSFSPLTNIILEPLLEKRGSADGKYSLSPQKQEEDTPLPLAETSCNIYGAVTKRKKDPVPTYDPLEGPSTLLDKTTKKLDKKSKTKNKSENIYKEPESDSDDGLLLFERQKRRTSKRKIEEPNSSSTVLLERKKMKQCIVELEDIQNIKEKKKNNIKSYKSKTKKVMNDEECVQDNNSLSNNIATVDLTTERKTIKPQSTKKQSSRTEDRSENSINQQSRISERIKEKSESPKNDNNNKPSTPKKTSQGTTKKSSRKKTDSLDSFKKISLRVNTRNKVKSYVEPNLNRKLRRSK